MYDLTNPVKDRYEVEKNKYRIENKRLDKKKLNISLLIEFLKRIGEIPFVLFAIMQAINGTITIGEVTLYVSFVLSVGGYFQAITNISSMEYIRTTEKIGIVAHVFQTAKKPRQHAIISVVQPMLVTV